MYCVYCQRHIGPVKNINWIALILLTLITSGVYLLFYIIYYVLLKKEKCPTCGNSLASESQHYNNYSESLLYLFRRSTNFLTSLNKREKLAVILIIITGFTLIGFKLNQISEVNKTQAEQTAKQKEELKQKQGENRQFHQRVADQIFIKESDYGYAESVGKTGNEFEAPIKFTVTNSSAHTVTGILTVKSMSKSNQLIDTKNIGIESLPPNSTKSYTVKILLTAPGYRISDHFDKELKFTKIDNETYQ